MCLWHLGLQPVLRTAPVTEIQGRFSGTMLPAVSKRDKRWSCKTSPSSESTTTLRETKTQQSPSPRIAQKPPLEGSLETVRKHHLRLGTGSAGRTSLEVGGRWLQAGPSASPAFCSLCTPHKQRALPFLLFRKQ